MIKPFFSNSYYDDDQEKFFSDIRIPNPFKALPAPPSLHNGLISSSSTYVSATSIDNKKVKNCHVYHGDNEVFASSFVCFKFFYISLCSDI